MLRALGVRILCVGLLGALLLEAPASGERITHLYRMQHREAAELLPLVETALAGEGTATVEPGTNSLVLVAEPRAIAVALELLAVQDRARRTVVLQAWSERRSDLAAAGYRIEWAAEPGALRLGRVRSGPAASAAEAGGGAGVLGAGAAAGRAGGLRASGYSEFAATLRIVEGEWGHIASGRSVPFVTRGEGGASTEVIEEQSGLLARPRVLGDGHVQVDLTPFDGSVEDSGATRFASASTRVVLVPGETLVVAGVERRGGAGDAEQPAAGSVKRDAALLLLDVEIE